MHGNAAWADSGAKPAQLALHLQCIKPCVLRHPLTGRAALHLTNHRALITEECKQVVVLMSQSLDCKKELSVIQDAGSLQQGRSQCAQCAGPTAHPHAATSLLLQASKALQATLLSLCLVLICFSPAGLLLFM